LAAAALFAAVALSTAACGDDGPPCVKSHTEQGPPIYVKSGNVMVPIPQSHTVCDEYAPESTGADQ
jgi:hypothetical protein